MITGLSKTIAKIKAAKRPEEVFEDPKDQASLRSSYTTLAAVLHPDRNGGAPGADEAMALLNVLYERATDKLAKGEWGKAAGATIIAGREYTNVRPLAFGDICDVYIGEYLHAAGHREAVIKVARSPRDGDLLANEAKTISALRAVTGDEALHFQRYLPTLMEQTRLKVGGIERAANIFAFEPDGFTLTYVIGRSGGALDPRHVAWIWKRILEGLDWTHRQGFAHGGLNPDHVLVFPKTHGIHLLDWCYAVKPGAPIKAISKGHRSYYPSEVLAKKAFTTGADIYMASKCVMAMLGGDTATGTMPSETPARFMGLLHASQLPSIHRYQDAFELYRELDKHLREMFGPPKFIPLNL